MTLNSLTLNDFKTKPIGKGRNCTLQSVHIVIEELVRGYRTYGYTVTGRELCRYAVVYNKLYFKGIHLKCNEFIMTWTKVLGRIELFLVHEMHGTKFLWVVMREYNIRGKHHKARVKQCFPGSISSLHLVNEIKTACRICPVDMRPFAGNKMPEHLKAHHWEDSSHLALFYVL